jgi:hypothetical protein
VVALFSKYFGWDISYTLSLSPCTIGLLQVSLSEILLAENGEVDKKKEFERNKKISAMQMDAIKNANKDKNGKFTLSLNDLMSIGSIGGKE